MKKRNIIFRKRMYPVIFIMIVAVIMIPLFLRSDIRFIVENTWNQRCLSAELDGVNFNKNVLKSVPILDITKDETDIVYNSTLCLINNRYPIRKELPFKLADYKDTGVFMDERIVESYAELSADVKKYVGDNLFVMSHYRNEQEQKNLYQEDNNTAALPGASEHQTGLALDVYVNGFAGSGFLKSDAGQYVNENSWKYGFIIRYPLLKKHITGIRFESWHIRFVGLPHSEIIYKEGLTLEEYISSLEIGNYYKYKNYYISRQEGDNLLIPYNLKEITVSPDNTGCYIITGMIV